MSTASPRDIIAKALAKALYERCPERGWARGSFEELDPMLQSERIAAAQNDLVRFTAAGFRIVREGELDAATVERCIEEIDCGCEPDHCPSPGFCVKDDVAALRSLIEEPKT